MNQHQAVTVCLKGHAERLESLAADLELKRTSALKLTADVINTANEIGSSVVCAQTEIAKTHAPFTVWEWVEESVAGLTGDMARRCVKVFRKQLTDPAQLWLSITVGGQQQEQTNTTTKRIDEDAWVVAARGVAKLIQAAKAKTIDDWPERQREAIRASLLPVARELWPEKF